MQSMLARIATASRQYLASLPLSWTKRLRISTVSHVGLLSSHELNWIGYPVSRPVGHFGQRVLHCYYGISAHVLSSIGLCGLSLS